MKLKEYQHQAEAMIRKDKKRDEAFVQYEKMRHVEWSLPYELQQLQWVRTVINTDPHDAVEAGVRVLATLLPRVRYTPLRGDENTKLWANKVEKNLLWQLKSANRRRSDNVVADVVRSALLYSAVALQVIDLDNHIEVVRANGGDVRQMNMMRRYSRFVVNTYNPRMIHTKANSFGPQCVLLCQDRALSEVISEWGLKDSKLKKMLENGEVTVKYYDWWDLEDRCVWMEFHDSEMEAVEIVNDKHGYEFLPWVAMLGGSTLESKEEEKYHPMLYSIHKSGQWETSNILQTLMTSEVIAHSASPRFKEEGANPDYATVDYGDPARTAKVPAGNSLIPLPPPPIDGAVAEAADRISAAMGKSTVSQVLMGGSLPSGTAYSTLNLATQSAMGALKPAKDLAEKALAEMFTQMMLWVQHTKAPLEAYGDGRFDAGVNYALEADDFDEESLYVEVELTPDVPTDRLQRVNAASLARQFGYSSEAALEDIGVTDPQQMMRQSMYEQYLQHKFNLMLDTERQQIQQAMQQAEQMAAQQMAQQQVGPVMKGQGFNPGMGGVPPAQAFPEMTRENINGADMSGVPLAGGL